MKNPAYDSSAFRRAMGHFASGVTIITTVDRDRVYGMTANAFCSVSLEPALVLVSVNVRGRMHAMLAHSGRYGVSILASQQENLSRHFSGRSQEQMLMPFVWHEGHPLIEGALAWVICRVVDAHLSGDHTLYIGQVESLGCSENGSPLLFYGGRYHALEPETLHRSTEPLGQFEGRTLGNDLLYEPSWW